MRCFFASSRLQIVYKEKEVKVPAPALAGPGDGTVITVEKSVEHIKEVPVDRVAFKTKVPVYVYLYVCACVFAGFGVGLVAGFGMAARGI